MAVVGNAPGASASAPASASGSGTSPAADYRTADAIARDGFNRTGTSLGQARIGGAWATSDPTGQLSLQGGVATWSGFTRGQTTHAWLPEVSAADAQLTASFPFTLISRAHYGMTHRIVLRRQDNGDGYVAAAAVLGSGRVNLSLSRVTDGVVSPLAALTDAARLTSNKVLRLQARVVGAGPVHLVARAWVKGEPRPDWQLDATDVDDAATTTAGAVGVNATMASTGAGRALRLTRVVGRELVPVP